MSTLIGNEAMRDRLENDANVKSRNRNVWLSTNTRSFFFHLIHRKILRTDQVKPYFVSVLKTMIWRNPLFRHWIKTN